jgi:hypothetical protein
MVWKRYEEPWSPTVAALADPARATAPTVSSPDATVAAATRRAFFLTDMMVSPFTVVRAIDGGADASQVMRWLWAFLWGTGGNSG